MGGRGHRNKNIKRCAGHCLAAPTKHHSNEERHQGSVDRRSDAGDSIAAADSPTLDLRLHERRLQVGEPQLWVAVAGLLRSTVDFGQLALRPSVEGLVPPKQREKSKQSKLCVPRGWVSSRERSRTGPVAGGAIR
jgi:hypothetical protein